MRALSDVAKETGVTLVGGSISESSDGKLYNTCCVIGKDGKLLAKHRCHPQPKNMFVDLVLHDYIADVMSMLCRKLHLFDIDIPGKITFKESLTLTGGQSPTVVDTDAGRLGIGICYDLRFPELAAIYAQRGVQLIVVPGG